MEKHNKMKIDREAVAKVIFALAAVFAIFSVVAIIAYLLYAGIPALREIGIFKFIFGTTWAPGYDGPASEKFGILPMIAGSIIATAGALAIGGTLGILLAIFIVYFCPKKLKSFFVQFISLLAGIPSVVYGYFGLKQIVPLLAKLSPNNNGTGILAVSLVLGIMILPTVANLAKNSLMSVPAMYYEGALALGMTKEQAIFRILVPSASSGIMTSLGLGMGRAVGETMAVIMVAGNTVKFPQGLFDGFMTLTGNIVMDMSYAMGIHRSALVATGFVLLIFILILNMILYKIKNKSIIKDKKNIKIQESNSKILDKLVYIQHNRLYVFLKYVCIVGTILISLAITYLVMFIIIRGCIAFGKIGVFNFLFGESGAGKNSLAPAFVSTGALILVSLVIALPIGICAAIYLVEYSKSGSKLVKIIRLFTDTLSGIPSIVFGLFGVIVFNDALGLGYSLLSGGLTLSIMILPTIIRSVEESLITVPLMYREASYALGSGKLHTIVKIVLPCAIKGILTAVILSIGRIVSESAALLLTAGSVKNMPNSITSPGSSFAVMMYMFASEGMYMDETYATALVLLILVVVINMLVLAINPKKEKKV